MMPSISGPSAISAASGEGELYTAAEMSASDGSCFCAAKLADAVPVSMASSKRILGLLEMTLIAVLLQTRSVACVIAACRPTAAPYGVSGCQNPLHSASLMCGIMDFLRVRANLAGT